MTLHQPIITESQRHAQAVRNSLMQPAGVTTAMKLRIKELEAENAELERQRDKALDDVLTVSLDVTELQGVILSQASRICELEGVYTSADAIVIKIPPKQIIAEVLQDFPGVSIADVMSARRSRMLVPARHACMKAVHERRPDLSYPQLGRIFNRDHTTILHAVGRLKKRIR